MGQQQLLLIVLSTIIVGISIAVGINMVTTSAGRANQDAGMQGILTLSERARDWYRKPVLAGGGGNSFVALATGTDMTAQLTWPATTEDGTYSIQTAGTATQVVFRFVGVEDQDGDAVNVTIDATVTRDGVTTAITNR
ncbi:MAG: hypothetical protein ACE5IY_01155 [bacterium]